jgi:hypothetical protein
MYGDPLLQIFPCNLFESPSSTHASTMADYVLRITIDVAVMKLQPSDNLCIARKGTVSLVEMTNDRSDFGN